MLTITGPTVLPKIKFKNLLKKLGRLSPDMELAIDVAYGVSKRWGIRADVILCQIYKETGYGVSWWASQYNYAGIGATGITSLLPKTQKPKLVSGNDWVWNEPDKIWYQGIPNADPIRAVEAVFGHNKGYTDKTYSTDAAFYDRRYDLLFETRKSLPVAKVLTDYNDTWAVTKKNGVIIPNHYGEEIEEIYRAAEAMPTS